MKEMIILITYESGLMVWVDYSVEAIESIVIDFDYIEELQIVAKQRKDEGVKHVSED